MARGAWPPSPDPLPTPAIDNHAHLDSIADGEDRSLEARLADAAAVGVDRIVTIGCDVESARWTVGAIESHPALVGGVAIHPNDAPEHAAGTHATGLDYDEAFAEIAALAVAPRVRVVGETGLDTYRTGPEGALAQERAFRDHIALAKETGRVLQIHDRDAHERILEILEADGAPERTVFHCFSGDAAMARHCVARGWYLSFAGNVTFANAGPLREALAETPLSRVLVETDSPYLTPHPNRGRPNGPYQLPWTIRTVAAVMGASEEEVCAATVATSEELYGPW